MTQFKPHPLYQFVIGALLFLAIILGWELRIGATPAALFFFVIVIVALLYFVNARMVVVTLTADTIYIDKSWARIWYRHRVAAYGVAEATPVGQPIALRQLTHVEQSGRLFSRLTLLYYPLHANDIINTEQIVSSTLPLLVDQERLQERLEASLLR